jgi:hypothetical protein
MTGVIAWGQSHAGHGARKNVTESVVRQDGNTTAIDLSYVSYALGNRIYGGWYRCTAGIIELIALGTVLRELRNLGPPLMQARCMLKRLVISARAPPSTDLGASPFWGTPPAQAQCCSETPATTSEPTAR